MSFGIIDTNITGILSIHWLQKVKGVTSGHFSRKIILLIKTFGLK